MRETEHASAAAQKVKGYMWSDNVGWVSLSCANLGAPGCNTYQVTVDSGTGDLSGMAWSANLGYLDFDAGCPVGAVGTCNATLVGNNLEGWARFVSNIPNPTPGNPAIWEGWVSFSSNSYVAPAPGIAYGPTLSGNTLAGNAWGSTTVGWLNFVDVTIDIQNVNTNLHLKPSANNSLLQPQITALGNTLTMAGPGNFELYWYTTDPTANYTSCAATSDGTTTWTAVSPLTPVPVDPAQSKQANVDFNLVPSQKYTLTCQRQGGGQDTAEAFVNTTPNISLRARELSDPPLTAANAIGAPVNISVPAGTPGVNLFWWKAPGSPNYTSCSASSTPFTNFTGNPMPIPTLPGNNPNWSSYSFAGPTTTYSISCTDGNVTDVSNDVIVTEGAPAACHVLSFTGSTLCPPGSPGYQPPGISWSTSNTTASCSAPWLTSPTNNNYTGGWQDLTGLIPDSFSISCVDASNNPCTPPANQPLALSYLPANHPLCQNGPAVYECNDGIDNDGDGLIDHVSVTPAGATPDTGCVGPTDPSELNKKVKVIEN